MGISSANPHEITLIHYEEPRGLKGLVYVLMCDRDSYKSGLGVLG